MRIVFEDVEGDTLALRIDKLNSGAPCIDIDLPQVTPLAFRPEDARRLGQELIRLADLAEKEQG